MTNSQYSLGFATPKRKKSKDGKLYIDLDDVELWIQNLPLGNAGQAARQLHSDIEFKNRIEMEYEDRIDCLELIHDSLFHINGIMENYFVGVNFPPSAKQQKIASTSRDFHYMLTLGYIIAIEELFEQADSPIEDENLALLIHRAITYLSRVLLVSNQVHVPVVNSIWEKLNKLYLFSEKYNVEHDLISDDQHQYIRKTTVAGEFARVVYLTLAEPYYLRNGEVSNVYINLERWLELISRCNITSDKKFEDDFTINLNRDAPPCYTKINADKKSSGYYRLFSTKRLITEIDAELERSELITSSTLVSANLGDACLGHGLLRRLIRSWTAIPDSDDISREINKKVELVIGISSVYDMLRTVSIKHQNDKDAQLSLQRNFKLHFEDVDISDATDIESIKIGSTSATEVSENNNSELTSTSIEKKLKSAIGNWKLLKQSNDEYYLQCKNNCLQQIQVGEIIGLRHPYKKNDEIAIAVISWLNTFGENGITFGARPISPTVIPIQIKMLADTSKKSEAQHAILLPQIKSLGIHSSIMTYPSPYRSGSMVSIIINKSNIPLKLANGLDNGGLYNRFQYERYSTVGQTKKKIKVTKSKKSKRSQTNDDDVWTSF